MNLDAFKRSLDDAQPPPGLEPALAALWWDARGDWHKAHECAQGQDDGRGAWVHAYLHRREGDLANAGYWYRRAGHPVSEETLEAEWEAIAATLLRPTR